MGIQSESELHIHWQFVNVAVWEALNMTEIEYKLIYFPYTRNISEVSYEIFLGIITQIFTATA